MNNYIKIKRKKGPNWENFKGLIGGLLCINCDMKPVFYSMFVTDYMKIHILHYIHIVCAFMGYNIYVINEIIQLFKKRNL